MDEALPECAQWQRDLIQKELDKRDESIRELVEVGQRLGSLLGSQSETIGSLRRQVEKLEQEIARIKDDIQGACGCTDGEDIRNHLAEYL